MSRIAVLLGGLSVPRKLLLIYLFSRPLPAHEFAAWLAAFRAAPWDSAAEA